MISNLLGFQKLFSRLAQEALYTEQIIGKQGEAEVGWALGRQNIRIANNCFDPTLITKLKNFHIQTISVILPAQAIIADPGKISANSRLQKSFHTNFLS
jgi:hypothetical protein